MAEETINRKPAVVEKAGPEGGTTGVEVDPILSRKELNETNPVLRQTKDAQEAFGLPSHVVPTPEQMDHISKFTRQERENEIVVQNENLDQFGAQPQDVGQTLDDSMIATGASSATTSAPVAKSPGIVDGANLKNLKAGFDLKRVGAGQELMQQQKMDEVAAINQEAKTDLQSKIDFNHLDRLRAAKDERDKAASEISAISRQFIKKKIDPSRWYSNRTTGQKIGIAISAFLSGFGGSDATLNMVQNAINNDIQSQKDNLARGGSQIKNMLASVSKIYGDDVDAEKYTRGIYLENVENQLKVNAAKAKTTEAASKLSSAIAAIRIEKEKVFESIAMSRAALRQSAIKDQEPSDSQRKAAQTLATAFQGFNAMDRALKKPGSNTFEWFGDDEYTAGMGKFVSGLGLLLSGAAVSDNERSDIERFVARYNDNKSVQKTKMISMRNLLNKYKKIILAKTVDELSDIIGGGKRNKFFKPSK